MACFAAAADAEKSHDLGRGGQEDGTGAALRLEGLILETPFTSLKNMVAALYPEKWLPYRYLGGFLWGDWDSKVAIERIGRRLRKPKVLILEAERDELVPRGHAGELEEGMRARGLTVESIRVKGALHNDVMEKSEARKVVAGFLRSIQTRQSS